MYSSGFYPFPDEETRWAWWARNIYFNRYIDAPKPVYQELHSLVKDKDYFVVTTNVDHQFQRAGFDKKRLFYTQGDADEIRPEDRIPVLVYSHKSCFASTVFYDTSIINDSKEMHHGEKRAVW